ncbi:transglutaminaseTgpA domain-containing protein [Aliikangiella coralliicola]|uniref:DUF3488 domain-containing protein n=1 Tax=Aliikangiella coralliicola TaxID=2592383 RepID=A0A545U0L9_9GAMM|nr:DUF3488 and transglutaminase-like domain-containing protein [Aliikangiella coralliicola]TQV82953.1 DUF3488 domain-containing protein [Aliikangiella coralliicola]
MNSAISKRQLQTRELPIIPIVIAQQCVLLPLYFFIPLWIVALNLFAAGLVVWSMKNKSFEVDRWLKLVITAAAIVGILVVFRKFSGRDAGVALISAMYGLKILETKKLRDANLLLSLGFFMLVAGFLFTQKPWIALYQFIPIIAILNALVSMQSIGRGKVVKRSLGQVIRSLSQYLLLALPIMIVLFLFFPRLGGPIWRMPGASTAASGVSDSMTPGDVSSLQLFDKVAFRAKFNGSAPNEKDLYWRMLTLGEYDGITWTRAGTTPYKLPESELTGKELIDYSITLEATRLNYLVTLDRPIKAPQRSTLLKDFTTYTPFRIMDRTRYQVTSAPTLPIETQLSDTQRSFYTNIPQDGNLKTKNWAQEQRQKYQSDAEFIHSVLVQINQQEYFYTLQPPIMREDVVDSFWFDYQRGFCEHYAGALVFIARAAGIPARVVIGYQGGEKNPLSDYWIVRYANAHAWTEIWYEDLGWVRIDPTAAIASHRVEQDLLTDYRQRESLFDNFDIVDLEDLGLFKQFEYWMDQVNNNWNDWILDYNSQRQRQLFSNWGFSKITNEQLIAFMLIIVSLFLGFISFRWLHQKDRKDQVARAYEKFQSKLAKEGLVNVDSTTGPMQLINQLKELEYSALVRSPHKSVRSKYEQHIKAIEAYIHYRYQNDKPDFKAKKNLLLQFRQV